MKMATKTILVPLDFSEQSFIALEQSYNLAKLSDSTLTLLHVVRENNSVFGLFSDNEKKDIIYKLKVKLDEYADVVHTKTGLKVDSLITNGKIVEKILETADSLSASFIVMGAKKPENVMKKVVGTKTLRVIQEASCPVISIEGKHHREGCENIILPLDLTKETTQKVANTLTIAKLFNSKVHAVSVVTTKDDYLISRMKLQMTQVQTFMQKSGIECETKMLNVSGSNNEICDSILNFANEAKGDLIVIMTQQESDITQYIVGSLAKELIHRSKIPIMSIVPKKK
ncbi:MAG: hypothetical protein A2033_00625 [Bacteroidetes bacterium GWA2_31_9]|nr:MAG: hypothetical protein A2033_00625 [Bacteroidetes bacterium GWA2_31_9]